MACKILPLVLLFSIYVPVSLHTQHTYANTYTPECCKNRTADTHLCPVPPPTPLQAAADEAAWAAKATERKRLGIGPPLRPSADNQWRLEQMYDDD